MSWPFKTGRIGRNVLREATYDDALSEVSREKGKGLETEQWCSNNDVKEEYFRLGYMRFL